MRQPLNPGTFEHASRECSPQKALFCGSQSLKIFKVKWAAPRRHLNQSWVTCIRIGHMEMGFIWKIFYKLIGRLGFIWIKVWGSRRACPNVHRIKLLELKHGKFQSVRIVDKLAIMVRSKEDSLCNRCMLLKLLKLFKKEIDCCKTWTKFWII